MTLLTVSYDLCPLEAAPVLGLRLLKVLKVLYLKVLKVLFTYKQQQHVVSLRKIKKTQQQIQKQAPACNHA